jgi:hypothetical protein
MAAGRTVCQRATALRAGGLMVFALEFFSSRIPIDLLIAAADDDQFREMARRWMLWP